MMSVEMVARTIQLILAPVVMVSGCALIANGLLTRYGAINERLRLLARENVTLLGQIESLGPVERERLLELTTLRPEISSRHAIAHLAVVAIYGAMLLFIACMFVIAGASVVMDNWLAGLALGVFLAATAVLFAGVSLAALEVHRAHWSTQFEADRVESFSIDLRLE
ncbi:MAG: DUF2721 domain-containing protein [Chloroflexota bacterium]